MGIERGGEIGVEEKQVFRYGVLFHKIFGIWPEDEQFLGTFSRVKGYGIAVITIGICVFQFSALMDNNNRPISENAIEFTASVAALAKVLPIVLSRNSVLNLLHMTNEFNSLKKVTVNEMKIINRWQSIQDGIIKFCIRSYIVVLVIYLCAPIFKNKGLPLQGIYPNIVVESPWYEMTYAVEIVLFLLRLFGVLSSDTFSITFMCQLCSQLELTEYSMSKLRSHTKDHFFAAIKRHVIALDYGCKICNNFSIIFLLQHILVAILLCLAGITALNTDDFFLFMKMLLMAIIAVITMLVICFVGETVTGASLEIASAIECYAYNAFLGDVAMLKLANFVLCRAQKPLCLSMGTQGTLNLRFFSESMNKVVSFFMILKTVME